MTSLRQRLTVSLLLSLGIVAIVFAAVFYAFIKRGFTEEFDYALTAKARALTSFPEAGRKGVNLQFTENELPEFSPHPHAEYFQVIVGGTNILSRSASLQEEILDLPIQSANNVAWTFRLVDRRAVRAVALRFAGTGDDDLIVIFVRGLEPLERRLRLLRWLLAIGGGLFLVIIVAVVRSAVRFGLHPVQKLAADVQDARFSSQLRPDDAPVELRSFVNEINSLLARLSDVFAREKRFTADVAHELTTPVAELRSMTDVALKWPDETAATEDLARKANDIARQMEGTVRSLLALARSESGQEKLQIEEFAPKQLIEESLATLQPKSQRKRLTVSAQSAPGVLRSDLILTRALCFNLLENAVEYTPEQGSIEIKSSFESGRFHLSIVNDQEGLLSEDTARMTDPFWRKDAARSDSSHAGLGLALVKAYATRLGGELILQLRADGRFEARVFIPHSPKPVRA